VCKKEVPKHQLVGSVASECALVVDLYAGIHDYLQAGRSGLGSSFFIDNPKLHPNYFGADLDRIVNYRRYVFASAKDYDHIHRFRYGE
jgi:hypothetical protein